MRCEIRRSTVGKVGVILALALTGGGSAQAASRSVAPGSGGWVNSAYKDEDRYTPGVPSNFDVNFDIGRQTGWSRRHPSRRRVILGSELIDPDTGDIMPGTADPPATIRVAGVCSYRQVYYATIWNAVVVKRGRFHVKNKRLDLRVRFTSRTKAVANVRIKFVGFGESCVQDHRIHLHRDSPGPENG